MAKCDKCMYIYLRYIACAKCNSAKSGHSLSSLKDKSANSFFLFSLFEFELTDEDLRRGKSEFSILVILIGFDSCVCLSLTIGRPIKRKNRQTNGRPIDRLQTFPVRQCQQWEFLRPSITSSSLSKHPSQFSRRIHAISLDG